MRVGSIITVSLACIFMCGCSHKSGPSVTLVSSPTAEVAPVPVVASTPPIDYQAPPAQVPPPVPQGAPQQDFGTPQDAVFQYLAWLSQFEQARQQSNASIKQRIMLLNQKIIAASSTGTPGMGLPENRSSYNGSEQPDPVDEGVKEMEKLVQEMEQIANQFATRTPPSACTQLASNYAMGLNTVASESRQSLETTRKRLSDIENQTYRGADQNQDANRPQGQADAAFNSANQELQSLLAQYPGAPQFSIRP